MPSHKSAKIREISTHLKNLKREGETPQLIFDEGEYFKTAALCSIKEFYDYLFGDCSIVIIGTSQLIDQIERLRKRDAKGIPQLYRRIKFGKRYLQPIDRRFVDFLGNLKDRKVVKWLQNNCANYGELHDVLVPCNREADRLEQPLTLNLISKVLNIPIHNSDVE